MATVSNPPKSWYVRGGKQVFMSTSLPPTQLFGRLNSVKGGWKKLFRPEMQACEDGMDMDEVEEQRVVACTKCSRVFSLSNPQASYKLHSDPTKTSYCKAEEKKKSASAMNELLHGFDDSDGGDFVGLDKVELSSSPHSAKQRSKVSA